MSAARSAFLALACLILVSGAHAEQLATSSARIEIAAEPIESFQPADPARKQFGALRFRGGLQLSSADRRFGGLSAIQMTGEGAHFIALTDKANWLRGRLVYRGESPVGVADAEMAPMLGEDGKPLAERGWFDTEALAQDGGTLYVGIERVHRIVKFNYGKDGLRARGQAIALPPGMAKLPGNKGLECLALPPKGMPLAGTLIAISERGLDAQGNIRGFLIGGKTAGEFTVRRTNDFDVVDCTVTPAGDLIILERFFTWRQGVAMRMRRLPLSAVKPGALLDGPVLIEADMGYQIDNMEGLSAHRAANGEIVLTLVSDDNFSVIQRTLLLQFTLLE